MEAIKHPESGDIILGNRLRPGTALEANDFYASTDGQWERCPAPGTIIESGCTTLWVRPQIDPDNVNEKVLIITHCCNVPKRPGQIIEGTTGCWECHEIELAQETGHGVVKFTPGLSLHL